MKKILKVLMVCFLIAGCFAYQSNAATIDQLQITTVDDIDGAEVLTENNIVIEDKNTQEMIWSFTIPKAGTVDVSYVSGDKAWHNYTLYKNETCVNSVGSITNNTTIYGFGTEVPKNERYNLEAGTYYLKMTKVTSTISKSIDNAPVKIYVAYENANSDEVYLPSSFEKANPLKPNEVFRGFITREKPSDYYTFTLTKGAKVSLDWFVQSNKSFDWATMYIYNQDKKQVGMQANYNIGSLINVLYLNAGKYYVELRIEKTLNPYRNGKTSIKMTTEPLPNITLTPSTTKPTNKNVKYTIKSSNLSPSESVEFALSDTQYAENSSLWDYGSRVSKPTTNFTINKNGIYYLRARYKADEKTVYTKITTITVKNIDKVAPKAPTVNAVKAKAVKVTGKGEKNASVIVTIGSKTYTGTVSASGTFSIKIPAAKKGQKISVKLKDAVGNISSAKTVTVR